MTNTIGAYQFTGILISSTSENIVLKNNHTRQVESYKIAVTPIEKN